MFRKKYKEDFDSICPDDEFIYNLSKRSTNRSPAKRPKIIKQLLAVAAIAAVAVCVLVDGNGITQYFNAPSFTMLAYADENSNAKVGIDENTRMKLPFGKISRGERHSNIDKSGKMVHSYDAGFENGGISVEGKNISSVTYACEKGEFNYYDKMMKDRMEKEGKITVCKFTVPVAVLGNDWEATFARLWNEGYFDSIKKEYFNNQSTKLSDYNVHFSQIGEEQIKNGIWTIEILYKFENGYPFEHAGKEVTANYYEERGTSSLDASWVPWYAIEILTEDKAVNNYADLPSDTITITVHFVNGKTATKQLNLSFDSYGNLIAQLNNI